MEEYKTADRMRHDKKKVMTVSQFMEEYCVGHNKAYELIHCRVSLWFSAKEKHLS